MNKLIKSLSPPDRWRIPVIIVTGIFVGLTSYSFYLSRATSYLSDSPKTCVNCHVMAPQYATWSHSSHHEAANCNDCHVPQDNFAKHWLFKAKDGLRHATVFTLRKEPQVIFIKEAGINVVQSNCIRCHSHIFESERKISSNYNHIAGRLCWECHRETPHGRVNSLSSVPHAQVPLPESPVPGWLKKYTSISAKSTNL
ncbi:MAG TPA: cytochrome c nitrite reductase small subunit [Bacteroidales bacterium]